MAWPRVRPDGGAVNPQGLAFYDRLVDELLGHGIDPWLTLYHWDLPQALEDRGGWTNRDTAHRFVDYATSVYDALGDRVPVWTTLNEPWCSAFLGYSAGVHAPGRQEGAAGLVAAHHLLLGHGLVARRPARARERRGRRGGISLNLTVADPVADEPVDHDAARRIDALHNRFFLDAVLRGRYPADLLRDTEHLGWQHVIARRRPRSDRHPDRRAGRELLPRRRGLGRSRCPARPTTTARRSGAARRRSPPPSTSRSRRATCRAPRWAGRSSPTGCAGCWSGCATTTPRRPSTSPRPARPTPTGSSTAGSTTRSGWPSSTPTCGRCTPRWPRASTCAASSCGRCSTTSSGPTATTSASASCTSTTTRSVVRRRPRRTGTPGWPPPASSSGESAGDPPGPLP